MLPFLKPLEIAFAFERRDYALGEVVEVDLAVKAHGDVEVAEGRIELRCRERFHEVHTVMAPVSRPVVPARLGGSQLPVVRVPKRVSEEFKNTSVHSQAVFMQGLRLAKGATETFKVSLEIGRDLPPYADRNSIMRWRLAAVVEQANGGTISKEKRIFVAW